MPSLLCQSIPLKDVIADLASQMQVKVEKNCDEYYLTLPTKYGEGSIRGIDFKDGMGIIIYDCTFIEDTEICFIVNNVHPLKFLFCETGRLSHRFENDNDPHQIDLLENIIVASSEKNGHILQFQAGLRTIINSLEINRKKFVEDKKCQLQSLEYTLQQLFHDTDASKAFYHHGNYCVRMADLFMEMDGFPKQDFLRYIFLEGCALKILTLQILQYEDDIAPIENKAVLRKHEIKMIQEAANVIDTEILDFKTVLALANSVGLNAHKLQNGFKKVYDCTVNEYVQKRRLDVANGLLKNSDLSISEIVYKIGLTSKSYFSKIFREKYGIPPSALRKDDPEKK